MKCVTTFIIDYIFVEDSTIDIDNDLHSKNTPTTTTTPSSTIKVDKNNFQEHCYGVLVQMTENTLVMVKKFEKTNALLEMVD